MNTSVIVGDVENTEADAAASDDDDDDDSQRPPSKKSKVVSTFQLDEDVTKLIKCDEQNRKLWDDALTFAEQGYQVILMSLSLSLIFTQ